MLAIILTATAQITGEDCSYAGGTLCVPKFCPAPDVVGLGLPIRDYYYTGKLPNGTTATVAFTPSFPGYEFDKICPETVDLANINSSNAAEVPYYFPVGCDEISPFPTYFPGTENCDPSNENCNPGFGILVGSSAALLPLWIVLMILLFYSMALVCEEFLVPGINIVCEKTGMPDDVAGATLLAAGCNSPEFFSSIIGIFIADSTVGVGTVVGSAPFNVCCITAGAALAVGGQLHLDPWLMARELLACFVTLMMFLVIMDDYLVQWWEALLMVAFYCCVYVPVLAKFDKIKGCLLGAVMRNHRVEEAFDEADPEILQLDVKTGESFSMNASGRHPTVSAKSMSMLSEPSPTRLAKLARASRDRADSVGLVSGQFERGGIGASVAKSLMKSLADSQQARFVVPQRDPARLPSSSLPRPSEDGGEPSVGPSLREISMSPTVAALDAEMGGGAVDVHAEWAQIVRECRKRCEGVLAPQTDSENGAGNGGSSLKLGQQVGGVELGGEGSIPPAVEMAGAAIAGSGGVDEPRMKGTLYKKSRFYSRVRMGKHIWQRRYFVLDDHPTHPFRYSRFAKPSPSSSAAAAVAPGEPVLERFVTIPLQLVHEVHRFSQHELRLSTPEQTYVLRSYYEGVDGAKAMQRWFDFLIVKLDEVRKTAPPTYTLAGEEEEHDHPPWYQMPEGAFNKCFHLFTLPIKLLVFPTVPDVNGDQPSLFTLCFDRKELRKLYPLTILLAMVWLAVFATCMTDVIEYLGCAIGVGTTVMGLSLGAVGTSFPNLYASILVAKTGQGDSAVCQAIASNTFNVNICLGLLWLIHGLGLGECDYGTHAGGTTGACNGCYSPSGFEPLCPFFLRTNNDNGQKAGSTKGAILLVFFWYVVFILTIVVGKNVVTKAPAFIMMLVYVLYLVYEFAAAFGAIPALCFSSLNICI